MYRHMINAESAGTIFYRITLKQLQNFYSTNQNIVLDYLVATLGFEAFKLDEMWGSYYDKPHNTFYYCVTDEKDIDVDGESVEPESALEDYGIDKLENYIQDGTDSEISRYFTEYELAPVDLNDVGDSLILEGYSFTDVLEAMNKLDLLDNIL